MREGLPGRQTKHKSGGRLAFLLGAAWLGFCETAEAVVST